jgi:ferredoxin-NADP reductase
MTDGQPSARGEERPPRRVWWTAEVLEIFPETPRVKTVRLRVPGWPGHRPGQHAVVRLTAEDGYQAQRSYSLASAPEAELPAREMLELTIERLEDGEVSPYLTEELRPGDRVELRGPIGGHFTWTVADGGPVILVAGGSGVVPLMSMLRHRARSKTLVPVCLVYSSRSYEEIIYREELERLSRAGDGFWLVHTLTRSQPPGWTGFRRRIDREMLAAVTPAPATRPLAFVCGPSEMVETVARALVELGHEPERVKTERFGATGG